MTKIDLVKAIKEYAKKLEAPIKEIEGVDAFELTLNKDLALYLKYHASDDPENGVSVEFAFYVGEITDINAYIPLFQLGRWKPSSYFLSAKVIDNIHYLTAEANVYLAPDVNIEEAAKILFFEGMIPLNTRPWPKGVKTYGF